jgi:putative tryptophan/tyrosine transport system substrate-binding protein
MRRREFLAGMSATAAWPVVAQARSDSGIRVIGYLHPLSDADDMRLGFGASFREGLRELGLVEGENLRIEARYGDRHFNRLQQLAADLVALNVELIVTVGPEATYATRAVTPTVSIVTIFGAYPWSGFVRTLAHPGSNVTGLALFFEQSTAKRIEFIKQVKPSPRSVGLIFQGQSDREPFSTLVSEMTEAAAKLDMRLTPVGVLQATEVERALVDARGDPLDGFVMVDSWFMADSELIAEVAQRRGLASVGPLTFASAGGLLGYGSDFIWMCRRAAYFVEKILRGANPGDIPIERPTKFQMIVNLRTAKALGLDLPPSLLAAADEFIE